MRGRRGDVLPPGGRPNSRGIGLEEVGVELSADGAVKVDDHFQTAVPSIYAVGDVIDRMQLTPVAHRRGHGGRRDTLFGGKPTKMDYENVAHRGVQQPAGRHASA